ncbi:uncharacterized protein LOC34622156 [Cyclospora cayetanensis]|uniref:guanylate cyclase n=1 Tax=Cyclospora cayetanensis TaxID=88456 RepID=A0A6P6RSD0_9EIME|nr:uncharacterized protein LOC34622156 [Cyclospora cayetanensis]
MSIVLRPSSWTEGAIMYAKGADTAMLPLLSSFNGMLQEYKMGRNYEGGADASGDEANLTQRGLNAPRNGNSHPGRPVPHRGGPGDREISSHTGHSDPMTYDTFYEAYHNLYKYSNDPGLAFKGVPVGGSRGEGNIAMVEQHLKVFSLQGLRTMVLACKYMCQDETDAYQRLYNDAYASVYSREERLEQVAEQFERDLEYLGITGVRDKLQAYVPETLELMMEAGIRVWIATGDDVEYALHICHSCRLLTSHTKVFHAALATRGKRAKREGMLLYDMFREARILKRADEHICLVVTGPNLGAFLNHPDLQTCFLNMACCCDVVVAARVTPTQKADMVRLVKKRLTPQPITLAIGDGGNDVPMLQEASVGVAIRTERGASVAGFADFAISEFRFLQRLLFVHGRLNFLRISKVILWTFFKSILLAFPVFLFQPSSFWSAIEIFDPVLYMLANFVWTTLPSIMYSFSEQDLPEHLLPSIPVLYTLGRRRLYFNGFTFSFWIVEGIIYSLLTYYLLQAAWMDSNALSGGPNMGFFSFGAILLFGLIMQSNLRILMETHLWTPTFLLTTVGLCTLLYIPVLFIYSATGWPFPGIFGIARGIFAWPLLYFVVLLWVGVGLMLQVLLAGFKASLFPNIATNVKQWLAQRQVEHDRRRRVTALPFEEPRLRLLPGGQDEYGCYCGRSSLISAIKRLLWICGFGSCLPAPGPVHQLVDPRILAFLRDKFNPLRHSDVSSKLPPPRRFRVNENFVTYGGEKKDKDVGTLEKDGVGSHGRGGGAADDGSIDTNSSGMSFDGDKARDQVKLVKVSHLINRFSLKFKDMQLEADYQIHQKKSFVKRLVPWYRVIFVFLGIYRIMAFLAEYFIDVYWGDAQHVLPWMCVPTVIVVLGFIGATLSTFSHFFMDHFSVVLSSVVFLMLAEHVTLYAAAKMDGILSSVLFPVFTFVILRISFLQAVMWNILFVSAFTIRYIIGQSHSYLYLSDLYDHLPLFLGSIVFVGFVGYRLEYNQRKSFLLDYSVEASRRKQREILNTMLPPFVVDQMINAPLNEDGIPSTLEADDRGTVSVVFCDVYEFQQVVASIEPTRLVEVLDSLFLCFDKSAEQFGCTKIETVFETYLAAAGLQPGKGGESDTSQTDAGDAMDMALAMLEVAAQIRYEVTRDLTSVVANVDDEQLAPASRLGSTAMVRQKTSTLRTVLRSRPQRIRVKIGINSGRVISGVVGAKKPQYALFGDTVNTASRMKTTGQPDYIHISESTYGLVKEDTTLIYESRKTTVKGKGDMNTYLLVRVLGSSYPNFGEDEPPLLDPLNSKEELPTHDFLQASASSAWDRLPGYWTGNPDAALHSNEALLQSAMSFSHEEKHTLEAPGVQAQSLPSTPRLTPGTLSRSSLSEALSPPEGSSPRTPSINSLERTSSRNHRSFSALSNGESGALSMTPQQLTRAYARQESVSRVLAFARDGLQTAVKEPSELKRHEIARQVHAQILREQLHHGNSSVWSSQEDMSVASNCIPPSVASLPQFRYSVSHTADIRNNSRIGRSISNRQSPRPLVAKQSTSEGRAVEMRKRQTFPAEPCLTTQGSSAGHAASRWRAANDLFFHIGTEAQAKFTGLLKVLGNSSKEEEHTVDLGMDDEDNFEAREARIGVSRESLLLMKFKDKNMEARYRTHFYNNKSNINTIEQAIIIFLVAFAVQTLVRLCMPWQYIEVVEGVKYTVEVSSELYWGVRATYTCAAFFLWILFHYRNRDEVASRLEIRWMVFLLNVLFISAACVFALSNSWSIQTTTREPQGGGGVATSSLTSASVLSPGVAIQTSTLGTDMLTYLRGGPTVRMPENVDVHSPVSFLSSKSVTPGQLVEAMENCPYDVCPGSGATTPTEDLPALWRRLSDNVPPKAIPASDVVNVPGQRGACFWLVSDSVELFFYVVILHHNTGLLFQNCILVDILLLTTCLTFILTAAVSSANTIGMVVNFPCYVFFNLVSAYWKEYIDRLTFYVNEHAKTTEGRATQLLNDMLPKQVLEEFQQDKLRLAYTHDRMTFLFADICGFTSWAKNVDACEVVTMLQKLFAKFDRDSTKYKLYKLCTIGDAYVAVSEPVTEDNEDYDPVEGTGLVLTMAQSMITNILEVRERLSIPSLNMRIGLHYGTCVGGVIGSGRLRYDLWGMDVLTGNMMESNGQPGKVNVSAVLRDFLLKHFPGKFQFRFNKTVCVINKTVDSYIIHPAGEVTDELAGDQAGPEPPLIPQPPGMSPGPSRDDSAKPELRGKRSRRGSIMGVHGSVGRRYSVRGSAEGSLPAESPRGSLPCASRPGSRASSCRSSAPQGEVQDKLLASQQLDAETHAGQLQCRPACTRLRSPAAGGCDPTALQDFNRSGSTAHTGAAPMHPITEEKAAPTSSPDVNSDSSPEIY